MCLTNWGRFDEVLVKHSLTRFVVSLLLTLLMPFALAAQWVQTNGPYGGFVQIFAVSGTNLYVGTGGGGVFVTTNNGTSWTGASAGMTVYRLREK
jgi:hypothetical protein